MRAVIQRCTAANVAVDGVVVGQIERGLVMFLGVAAGDDASCAERLAGKTLRLRIFNDAGGKFNLSLQDVGGAVLVVSNFTVCGDARKGTRPSFSGAAPAAEAETLYRLLVEMLRRDGARVQTGKFGAHMNVLVENDGPVTMLLDVVP